MDGPEAAVIPKTAILADRRRKPGPIEHSQSNASPPWTGIKAKQYREEVDELKIGWT